MERPRDGQRYYGPHLGIVKDRDDPKMLGRLKLAVPNIFGPDWLTNWALPAGHTYGGRPDQGAFVVPEMEASVWLEFKDGNVDRPVWTAVWWGEPEAEQEGGGEKKPEPEPPKLARGIKDETTEDPKGTAETTAADGTEVKEPPSPYLGEYPQVKVYKSIQGIVIELDDTVDEDGNPQVRIHVWHPKKTYWEIAPDGSLRHRVMGEVRYCFVAGRDELHVAGAQHIIVEGDATFRCLQDHTVLVEGDQHIHVKGKRTLIVDGELEEEVGEDVTQSYGANRSVEIEGDDVREAGGKIEDKADEGVQHN